MQSVDNSTDGAQTYMARPVRFLKILSNSVRALYTAKHDTENK